MTSYVAPRLPRNKPAHYTFIFCVWLWFVSFGYLFGIYPVAHLVLLAGAFLFTVVYGYLFIAKQLYPFIVGWELLVLFITYNRWRALSTVDEYRLLPDVVLFGVYLLYIYAHGHTFYSIYFKDNAAFQKHTSHTISEYVLTRVVDP